MRMGQRDRKHAMRLLKADTEYIEHGRRLSIIDYYDTKDEATGRLNGKEVSK